MNYPIRIAQIMGKMNNGGVEAVIMNYYRQIDKDKFQFDFIVDSDSLLPQRSEIESLGGKIYIVPPYSKVGAYRKALSKIFKENNYIIVHSNLTTLNIFPLRVAKKCGIPVRISHSHNSMGKGEFLKTCLKLCFRVFSNLYLTERFACSEHAGEWLFKGKKFKVINNSIPYEKYLFSLETREKLRSLYNFSKNDIVIGHIGRFNSQKNHVFIINLYKKLLESNSNYKLFLIGEGPEKAKIKNMILEMGISNNVIIVDSVNNAFDYYNLFDVFVLPSNYEGFGNVVVEAQVNGLSTLVSNKVPIATQISNQVEFLPLEYSKWVEKIKHISLSRGTSNLDYKYDLLYNTKRLEGIYYELINQVKN